MGSRPELQAPPDVYYNDKEARKYTTSSRIIEIQEKLTQRAVELLNLPKDGGPRLLLDLGCGSGLSGECLSELGHHWIGWDISRPMLEVAMEREVQGDLLLHDLGHGLGLRSAVFDGAISISAIQWLCNADRSSDGPHQRLKRFFQSLYRSLAKGARAVFQFYPQGQKQIELITTSAMKAGFSGGLVIDYPHSTRAKKYFLCLMAGPPRADAPMPKAKGLDGRMEVDEEESSDGEEGSDEAEDDEVDGYGGTVKVEERVRALKRRKSDGKRVKGRGWVLLKKEQRRKRGVTDVGQRTAINIWTRHLGGAGQVYLFHSIAEMRLFLNIGMPRSTLPVLVLGVLAVQQFFISAVVCTSPEQQQQHQQELGEAYGDSQEVPLQTAKPEGEDDGAILSSLLPMHIVEVHWNESSANCTHNCFVQVWRIEESPEAFCREAKGTGLQSSELTHDTCVGDGDTQHNSEGAQSNAQRGNENILRECRRAVDAEDGLEPALLESVTIGCGDDDKQSQLSENEQQLGNVPSDGIAPCSLLNGQGEDRRPSQELLLSTPVHAHVPIFDLRPGIYNLTIDCGRWPTITSSSPLASSLRPGERHCDSHPRSVLASIPLRREGKDERHGDHSAVDVFDDWTAEVLANFTLEERETPITESRWLKVYSFVKIGVLRCWLHPLREITLILLVAAGAYALVPTAVRFFDDLI
ncbi:hypothetical protein CBR_g3667 [Chara braunii]|uniref:Methyltransferase type 11 domain-containing protein n=1 Tax=Chara braunii TaxID=69332 RepID=A0A388KG28_CHABU|nr:hypothetical protein CBR_g3667 [Chara braunii]|eukprot:GBG68968.1 hypothetical protein CBR_g3667 [Chara braunii]